MPSPFPGMDPYLEDPALWGGVHQALIAYSREMLQPELIARGYFADIGERMLVSSGPRRSIYPDLYVVERTKPRGESTVAVMEPDAPVEVEIWDEEERQVFVEIYTSAGELVTILELLSPSNKEPGAGHRDQYQLKQREILDSDVNLVEIDLLRAGQHTLAVPEQVLRTDSRLGTWNYMVCVHRAHRGQRYQLYPISIRNRLPRIRVPLKPGDDDVVLDVQAVFDRCYDSGPYPMRVNYRADPPQPLLGDDAQWAFGLLHDRNLPEPA